MKGFLEEYGLIIVVTSVIMVMLLLGTTVGADAKDNIVATVANFLTIAEQVEPELTNPGGTNLSDLNEYGFYYGKRYAAPVENAPNEGGMSPSNADFIFYKDGTLEMIMKMPAEAGTFVYSNNLIEMNGQSGEYTVEENGNKLVSITNPETDVASLVKTPTTEKNIYGFYFGEKYCFSDTQQGITMNGSYIFNEDGSAIMEAGVAGNWTFENGKIIAELFGSGAPMTPAPDGETITIDASGVVLTAVH